MPSKRVPPETPVCVTVRPAGDGGADLASEPVCRMVVDAQSGALVEAAGLVAPAELRVGQCVNLAPGQSWDAPNQVAWFRVTACGGGSGSVFHREGTGVPADQASNTCAGVLSSQGRAGVVFGYTTAASDPGGPALTCVVRSI